MAVGNLTLSTSFVPRFVGEYLVQLILVSIITVFLYKLYKERRSKNLPPGPIGLPIVGYLPFLGEEPHKKLLDLSKKYGNIISLRMGPKLTVVLNEYKVMKETLSHPAALDRAPHLFDHIPELGFIIRNGEEWVEQRRFSLQSMRDLGLGKGPWETIVMEEVSYFVDMLSSYKGKPVDISHQLSAAISNNILSLLIGRRLERGVEDDKINLIVDYADVSFSYMGPSLMTTLIPGLRKIFQVFKIAGYDRAAKAVSGFCALVKEEIRKHESPSEAKGLTDFIGHYLEEKEQKVAKENKHYFSDVNLEGNVKILFLGASDTIFSSMGWIFRLMAEYTDIQKKVQNELDEVIGRDGKINYYERFKVPYTFAVIMESQRFSSIVPLSTTRVANSDFQIGGYTIPKGTEIVANLWALHNDSDYWDEPEKFKPERFLKDNRNLIINSSSYAPFSIGRRNCPGETVALMEILVLFTSVMQRFTITTPPGVKPNFDIVNGLVAHLKPQPLCFIERHESE